MTHAKKLAENQWAEFEARVRGVRAFFDGSGRIDGARAPGRLDVLGGVADYSGGTVLEATLADATFVAVQKREDRRLKMYSDGARESGFRDTVQIDLDSLIRDGTVVTLDEAKVLLAARPEERWAAYVAGCLYLLLQSGVLPIERACGLNIFVSSHVPVGAGVSSSAALEVSTMLALCGLLGAPVDGMSLARLCQKVENQVVGAPCGIMDQVTSALGRANALLVLKCQPHDILGHVPVPRGWRFVGLDSGVKHAVGGRSYTRARVAAFIGFKIIQVLSRDRWGGYLCNISPDAWQPWRDRIPASMDGRTFLEQYGGIDDPVAAIDSNETYAVCACAEHAVTENDRVRQFMALMDLARSEPDDQLLAECGRLMLETHASYTSRLDLGSKETDLLVNLAMAQGPERGIYGAKITGGGSGGTVAILCAGSTAEVAITDICQRYEQSTGINPRLMSGSSPGAVEFGVRTLDR